jgi:hypothetical protein
MKPASLFALCCLLCIAYADYSRPNLSPVVLIVFPAWLMLLGEAGGA